MANNRLKLIHKDLEYQECPTIMKYYPSTGWYFSFDNMDQKVQELNKFFEAKNINQEECELALESHEGVDMLSLTTP